jgi:cytochrome c-type biogenesis protein CcmH/NrfG
VQFSISFTVATALILSGGFFSVWLWRHRRRYIAYGTSACALTAATLLLVPANDSRTSEHDVVSLGLAAGYVDFNKAPARTAAQPRQTSRSGLPSVPAMIRQLESRLASEPGDAKGWSLLAQSYAYVGNRSGAESAIENAVLLGIEESTLRSQIAAVESSN